MSLLDLRDAIEQVIPAWVVLVAVLVAVASLVFVLHDRRR